MTHLIHKEYYSGSKYRDREQKSERGEAFSEDFRGYFSGKNMSNHHNDYGTGSMTGSEPVKMKTEAINSAFQASQNSKSSGLEQYI